MPDRTTRPAILEAMDRLIDGQPQRSDGKLTIKSLAAEAGVPRHHLTELHTDLKDQFYARIRQQNPHQPALVEERQRRESAEREAMAWKARAVAAEAERDAVVRALHLAVQVRGRVGLMAEPPPLRVLPPD